MCYASFARIFYIYLSAFNIWKRFQYLIFIHIYLHMHPFIAHRIYIYIYNMKWGFSRPLMLKPHLYFTQMHSHFNWKQMNVICIRWITSCQHYTPGQYIKYQLTITFLYRSREIACRCRGSNSFRVLVNSTMPLMFDKVSWWSISM